MSGRPQRTRTYQNHHLDSTRWDEVELRPGDILISTSYKAGTTWTQTIVGHLIFWGEMPEVLLAASPWIDMRIRPLDEIREAIAEQTHRRFLKTHLPLDGLSFRDDVQYIVVGRDGRDVFMSLWNHYRNQTDTINTLLNEVPGRVGDPFPPCPDDIRELFQGWVSRGWFEWESDGYPYWSHLHHMKTWWEWRHLPNILFVHYADMLADLEGEVRRIANFLGIEHEEGAWAEIADACRFDNVKKNTDRITGDMSLGFKGGAQTFIHKGTNGRWKDVLTAGDLAKYQSAVERVLPPDCAQWLENGGPVAK